MTPTTMRARRGTILVLCAVFLASGLLMAALGPSLPDLAARTSSDLSELGRIFVAIFGGALAAQILGGHTSDRFGRRIVLVIGSLLYGFGALGVASSTRLWVTLASAVVLGLGYGGTTLAVNVLASELTPRRRATTVNLVNVFYAAGAIAGPLVAGLFLDRGRPAVSAVWMGVGLVFLLVPVCARAIPGGVLPQHPAPGDAAAPAGGTGFIVACGIFLPLYVGSESATGAWAPVYLQRSAGLDASGAASSTAVFWFAPLCAGRMLAVLAGMHLSAQRLLVVSLAGSAAGRAQPRDRPRDGVDEHCRAGATGLLVRTDLSHSDRHRHWPLPAHGGRGHEPHRRARLTRRDAVPLAARPGAHSRHDGRQRTIDARDHRRDGADVDEESTMSHVRAIRPAPRPRRPKSRPRSIWRRRRALGATEIRSAVFRRVRSECPACREFLAADRAGPGCVGVAPTRRVTSSTVTIDWLYCWRFLKMRIDLALLRLTTAATPRPTLRDRSIPGVPRGWSARRPGPTNRIRISPARTSPPHRSPRPAGPGAASRGPVCPKPLWPKLLWPKPLWPAPPGPGLPCPGCLAPGPMPPTPIEPAGPVCGPKPGRPWSSIGDSTRKSPPVIGSLYFLRRNFC